MRIPVELLVFACLVVGIAPSISIGPSLAAAARPVVGGVLPEYSLAVWHAFNAPLVMSLVAIGGGIASYVWLRKQQLQGRLAAPPGATSLDGKRLFESALVGLTRLARNALWVAGTRRLQPQMFAIVATALLLALLSTRGTPFVWGDRDRLPPSPAFVLLWVIGMVRRGGGREGKVSTTGRDHDDGRRRARHLPDVCVVLGA